MGFFWGGLSQGIGQGYSQQSRMEFERKERERNVTHEALSNLFQQKAAMGDNAGAADILEQMGTNLGGKPKNRESSPFYHIADQIRQAKPQTQLQPGGVSLTQPSTGDIQSKAETLPMQPPGPPASPGVGPSAPASSMGNMTDTMTATTPGGQSLQAATTGEIQPSLGTKVTQQGYFPTPEERAARETNIQVTREKQLMEQVKIPEYRMQKEIWTAQQQALWGTRHDYKMEELGQQGLMKATQKYNEALARITGGDIENATPDQRAQASAEAKELADSIVAKNQATTAELRARASEYDTRHGDRLARIKVQQQEADARLQHYQAQTQHWNQQITQGNRRLDQGDIKNSIALAKSAGSAEAIKSYRERQKTLTDNATRLRQALDSAFNTDPDKAADLKRALDENETELNDVSSKLDGAIKEYDANKSNININTNTGGGGKTLNPTKPPNKTLNKTNTTTDPMGIR